MSSDIKNDRKIRIQNVFSYISFVNIYKTNIPNRLHNRPRIKHASESDITVELPETFTEKSTLFKALGTDVGKLDTLRIPHTLIYIWQYEKRRSCTRSHVVELSPPFERSMMSINQWYTVPSQATDTGGHYYIIISVKSAGYPYIKYIIMIDSVTSSIELLARSPLMMATHFKRHYVQSDQRYFNFDGNLRLSSVWLAFMSPFIEDNFVFSVIFFSMGYESAFCLRSICVVCVVHSHDLCFIFKTSCFS